MLRMEKIRSEQKNVARFCDFFYYFFSTTLKYSLLQGFMINAHESGSNSPGRGLLAGIWPKQSTCSAGILPGLIEKNIPLLYGPWGDVVANDWCIMEFFKASLYVWCLRYWALCDHLVVFILWAGVIYLSFSIDTATQWILWKRSKEDMWSHTNHLKNLRKKLLPTAYSHCLWVFLVGFWYIVNQSFQNMIKSKLLRVFHLADETIWRQRLWACDGSPTLWIQKWKWLKLAQTYWCYSQKSQQNQSISAEKHKGY